MLATQLLQAGCDVHYVNAPGARGSALHEAGYNDASDADALPHLPATQLLQAGCDVHYVNCMPGARGSALHEAAYNDADAAVAVLLRSGACPWAANQ